MAVLRIILLSLCLVAVTAQAAFSILLARMARQGQSGTEIVAVAFMLATLVVSFVAVPSGVWLAFDLATDARSASPRFAYSVVGSALAAYLAVTLLVPHQATFALATTSRRRLSAAWLFRQMM